MKHNFSRQLLLASTVLMSASNAMAQQEEPTKLQKIVVKSDEGRSDTSDTLTPRATRSATKTNAPLIETPQAATTITRKQIDEQNPQTVGQSLRYTAGVLSDRDATSRYDSVFLRGFGAFGTATTYVTFLDGVRLVRGQAFATPSTDPFFLDHVDVLKGPSALLYGQISPGGLVNQVSREPSSTPLNEVRLEAGTDGRIQSGLYTSGPLSTDGAFQYGLGLVGRSSGTTYDDVKEQRLGVSPTVKWQPDEDTSLTISGSYQRDPEGGYFNSIYPRFLAPAGLAGYLDPDLDVGDPSFDSFQRTQYNVGYRFEHRFNDNIAIRSNFRYSGVDTDMQSLQMAAPLSATGEISRYAVRSIEDARGFSFDNHGEFKFDTGAASHTMLAGVDIQQSSSSWEYLMGAATTLNVLDPVYNQPVGPFATVIDSDQRLRQTGVYLQDQVELGKLRAVFGVRHDWTKQETDNLLAGTSSDQSSDATSYRAGLLYLFDNGIAPYVSYSTSFEPQIGVTEGGDPYKPTEAQQYEIGVKYQPDGLDALFTVAAFDIRQQNVLSPGSTTGFYIQQGEVHSRGLEFEARGEITDNVDLIAALSLLDTKVSESSDASVIGNRPQATPNYYGSVWGNYKIDGTMLEGLSIGGGVRFVGSSYGDDANTVKAPGYALLDAALKYDFGVSQPKLKGLEATLNVTNLLDKEYYTSCSYSFYCQYGTGRAAVAGLRFKW